MSGLALDVCHAGDVVYLTLDPAGGGVSQSHAGSAWLVLNDSLHIDVTCHSDQQKRPVIVRLPVGDLPQSGEGAIEITAKLTTDSGSTPLTPVVRRLGPADRMKGHIATVSGGALRGWVTDETRRTEEVPVEVTLADRTLISMSSGRWHKDLPRAFAVPLPADPPLDEPMRVTVRATPDGAPFARSPLYLTLTSAGWLLATPIRRRRSALEGEFLLAQAPDKPVSVILTLADGQTFQAECALETEVRFGGRPCGFRFDNLPDTGLENARLTVTHETLRGGGLGFEMSAFFPWPVQAAFETT